MSHELNVLMMFGDPSSVHVSHIIAGEVFVQAIRVFTLIAVGAPEVGQTVLRCMVMTEMPGPHDPASVVVATENITNGHTVRAQDAARFIGKLRTIIVELAVAVWV